MEDNKQNIYSDNSDLYGKKIQAVAKPEANISIDTHSTIIDNLVDQGLSGSGLNMSAINSFTRISENRNSLYDMLDDMSKDITVNAVLETYAEDATEPGDSGRIIWCESDDADIAKYINYLLDTMNVDKNAYEWTLSLIKYGDLYLRLYRESDMQDHLFNEDELDKLDKINDIKNGRKTLTEDIKINKYHKSDNYTHYVEMVPNPAEMFELTKFGKTYGYIRADVNKNAGNQDNTYSQLYQYNFSKKDINIFEATEFVHACLADNNSRFPEEVNIYTDDVNSGDSYSVKRGQSLLYPVYKLWRELSLLENSLLLNRLTKSSIVRVVNVEVGDMPKENVGPHLQGIKQMIEQKTAINKGSSFEEYTNPGPIENNIFIPTRQGIGALSTQQVGGDIDVKGIVDIDYYQNKLFGGFRVPKQYFGLTEDGAGFNGGQSLSIISSRYAKAIKRIQNTEIQAITDAINLMLLDKGFDSYINKFSIKMLAPTTQEEIDRQENLANKVQLTSDIMNMLDDIQNPADKLKILKSLLSKIITDPEIYTIIDEQIKEYIDAGATLDEDEEDSEGPAMSGGRPSFRSDDFDSSEPLGLNNDALGEEPEIPESSSMSAEEVPNEESGEMILPTGNDLNIDLTND